ncbi:MAG: hypothetical protein M5U09_22355 [Gammaproteobacteria bacterium]|nr:hypothetical protein [Gammaproteobacteria bacterium]
MTAAPAVATADWRGPPKYGYGRVMVKATARGYRQGYRKGGGNAGWGRASPRARFSGLGLGVIATTPRPAPYYAPGYYAPDCYTPQPYYTRRHRLRRSTIRGADGSPCRMVHHPVSKLQSGDQHLHRL